MWATSTNLAQFPWKEISSKTLRIKPKSENECRNKERQICSASIRLRHRHLQKGIPSLSLSLGIEFNEGERNRDFRDAR